MNNVTLQDSGQTIASFADPKTGDVLWMYASNAKGYEVWFYVGRKAPFFFFVKAPSGETRWVELSTIANGTKASFAPFYTVMGATLTRDNVFKQLTLKDPSPDGASLVLDIEPNGPDVAFRAGGGSLGDFSISQLVERSLLIGGDKIGLADVSTDPLGILTIPMPPLPWKSDPSKPTTDPKVIPDFTEPARPPMERSAVWPVVAFATALGVTAIAGAIVLKATAKD